MLIFTVTHKRSYVFHVFVWFYILTWINSACGFLSNSRQDPCVVTGVEILRESKELKRIRAVFNIETRRAYYRVKFCRHFTMCFAATIENRILDEDIVNDIGLWTKLIRTIQGKGHFMPYSKETHSEGYGGQSDYFNCSKGMYIITSKPSPQDILNLTRTFQTTCRKSLGANARRKRGKNADFFPRTCLSEHVCTRTCLHKNEKRLHCHEVRLVCNFGCTKRSRQLPFYKTKPCKKNRRQNGKKHSNNPPRVSG